MYGRLYAPRTVLGTARPHRSSRLRPDGTPRYIRTSTAAELPRNRPVAQLGLDGTIVEDQWTATSTARETLARYGCPRARRCESNFVTTHTIITSDAPPVAPDDRRPKLEPVNSSRERTFSSCEDALTVAIGATLRAATAVQFGNSPTAGDRTLATVVPPRPAARAGRRRGLSSSRYSQAYGPTPARTPRAQIPARRRRRRLRVGSTGLQHGSPRKFDGSGIAAAIRLPHVLHWYAHRNSSGADAAYVFCSTFATSSPYVGPPLRPIATPFRPSARRTK